ncbi:hypothetical protein L218DRAFT_974660 [Marasmius fiardii PR-910]|nr:hypothetical protein L218DRAFT_974660 [Marasmius fiardii PR-910]
MFTKHTYVLSEDIQIFFTDSGPPPNYNDYTTLVVFHGSAFNGFGFERLHGVASQHNLRTIVWNRRDYPGSTPYTDFELGNLKLAPKTFMNRIGSQIGEFLAKFIEQEKIPKATDDGKAGGIAIMGWSMGTATAMSLFSHSDILPPQTYSMLEQYVKDLVLNDSPYLCFGFKFPSEVPTYDPWTDTDAKTPQEKYQRFLVWASSFYDHPNPESGDLCDIDLISKGTADNTITKWSNEEFERYFNKEAAVRSEFPMCALLNF